MALHMGLMDDRLAWGADTRWQLASRDSTGPTSSCSSRRAVDTKNSSPYMTCAGATMGTLLRWVSLGPRIPAFMEMTVRKCPDRFHLITPERIIGK